jgi:SAM-dependent methyltransferase
LVTTVGSVGRDECAVGPTTQANRSWWDGSAAAYQAEHGQFLGDADFCWGPEGLREARAQLLGPVRGARVLEIGCGAAQCSRWLAGAGARPIGVDISLAQLRHARALDRRTGAAVPVLAADAARLPLRAGSFDLACSAYGALPFVADATAVHREVGRVLRPGGRWVFSVTHPVRWCLPDDPGPDGLTVRDSYFDRRAYVEYDATGTPSYVEHHRTLGDHVRQVVAAGLELLDLVEPEWPEGNERTWGGWSALRGRLIPGTAIFVTRKPG